MYTNSWFVQICGRLYLTIGLAMQNFQNMTPHVDIIINIPQYRSIPYQNEPNQLQLKHTDHNWLSVNFYSKVFLDLWPSFIDFNEILEINSWYVQLCSWFDLTIGLAIKNYPKMTPHIFNFSQNIPNYKTKPYQTIPNSTKSAVT